MGYSKHFFKSGVNVTADIAAFCFSMLLSAKFAGGYLTGFSLRYMLQMRLSVGNIIGAALLVALWILIFRSRALYRPRHTAFKLGHEAFDVGIAAGIGVMSFAAIGLFFNVRLFAPLFLLMFWFSSAASTVVFRVLLQWLLGLIHLGDNNKSNVLIVGTNETAWKYVQSIEEASAVGYHVLGFLDDLVLISESKVRHLGKFGDFTALLQSQVVDEVVIAMPMHSYGAAIQKIIDESHERGIAVRFPMSQVFAGLTRNQVWRVRQETSLGPKGEYSGDLVVYSGHLLSGRYLVKRLFDIVFSATLIVLTSPIQLVAALFIGFSSGWPVVFVQDRYGFNGRVVKLYKFRTMVKNAESIQAQLMAQNERDGAAFKMKNDPRVTTVGRFLRKTSIDELPQLFNVLKGEMSVVGPRPLPLADYARMDNISHRRRLSVLPGITGPWQISNREKVGFDEWMQMDLEYIDNWRIITDIKIILLTVPIVLFGHGAS